MNHTAAQRLQAREAILHWHRDIRSTRARCGAKRKHDGQPCQQLAMGNGRCAYHGGRTPAGAGWHRPRWPKAERPGAEAKLNRKLRDLDRAARKRELRLEAMTPDERRRHDTWHASRKPGSAATRARAKAERRAAAEIAAIIEKPAEQARSPELVALDRLLDEAKRHAVALDAADLGIFG